MSDFETLTIDVNGFPTRVWRKGSGPKIGFLAGFGGLPRWMPFLDELAEYLPLASSASVPLHVRLDQLITKQYLTKPKPVPDSKKTPAPP